MASSSPKRDNRADDELDLVRQALDYTPDDVLRDLADEEDIRVLETIDERLDRTVVERREEEAEHSQVAAAPTEPIQAQEPEPEEEEAETEPEPLTEDLEEEPEPEEEEAETEPRPVEILLAEHPEQPFEEPDPAPEPEASEPEEEDDIVQPVEVVLEETEDATEREEVEVVLTEGEPEQEQAESVDLYLTEEEEADDEEVEVILAEEEPEPSSEELEEELEAEDEPADLPEPPEDSLNAFTVVTPPTGSIQGDWVLEDDEPIVGTIGPELGAEPWPEPAREEPAQSDELVAEPEPEQEAVETPLEFTEVEPEPRLGETLARQDGPDPFGDVHPVEDVEGIGPTYGDQLREFGCEDTRELWHADADWLADEMGISSKRVRNWQRMAELIALDGVGPQYGELLVRSGVHSIHELAPADADELTPRVQETEDELIPNIQGNKVGKTRVEGWIRIANEHEGGEIPEPEVDEVPAEAETTAEVEWPDPPSQETAATAEEAEPPEAETPPEPGYTHGPYTLYHKTVDTGAGETRDLYFFARNPPEDASPTDLPEGYDVGVNERTGVPFVRKPS